MQATTGWFGSGDGFQWIKLSSGRKQTMAGTACQDEPRQSHRDVGFPLYRTECCRPNSPSSLVVSSCARRLPLSLRPPLPPHLRETRLRNTPSDWLVKRDSFVAREEIAEQQFERYWKGSELRQRLECYPKGSILMPIFYLYVSPPETVCPSCTCLASTWYPRPKSRP